MWLTGHPGMTLLVDVASHIYVVVGQDCDAKTGECYLGVRPDI